MSANVKNVDSNSTGLFECKVVTPEQLSEFPDAINDIHTGKINAMWIKGVFSKEEMQRVVERTKSKQDEFVSVRYGATLGKAFFTTGSEEERADYLASATRFREILGELFDSDAEATVESIFAAVSGNRPVAIANEGPDRVYTPLTIRFVREGLGGMVIHRGNEFLVDPALSHLNNVAQMTGWVSFFIVMQNAKKGGELVLYDVPESHLERAREDMDFDSYDNQVLRLEPGDMVMFHGGQIYHQVLDISGDVERVTMGGFTTVSKDNERIFYWS